ncbi:MAG: low molecular weight protein arginine phosphatase [Clostridiales bacterium]
MKKILFVCTGNTCRSPMAEGLMNMIIHQTAELKNQFIAHSVGISAFDGQTPNKNALSVLNRFWNCDIKNYKATLINSTILEESYIILTMTKSHKDYLLNNFPLTKNKLYILKEYIKSESFNTDISDPFCKDISIYENCAKELYELLLDLKEILIKKI